MKNFLSINALKRVHIMGISGTLMGAFAVYLKHQGIEVSGSDENSYPPMSDVLKEAGIFFLKGYKKENLFISGSLPDLVVIGNVIRSVNVEALAAKDLGLLIYSLPEAMEFLFLKNTRNLVVSGTHGKTTTSSLLAHVLIQCKKNPNYFIGGVSKDLPNSFHISNLSEKSFFVLEGDEYDTAFWDKVPKFNHYLPDEVILTSIEYDHADIYPDFQSVLNAFKGLIQRIRKGGKLIACYDDASVRALALQANVPVFSYGSQSHVGSRFIAKNSFIRPKDGFTSFEIFDGGQLVDQITIQLSGNHNILNALSVWILCQERIGGTQEEREKMRKAFESFRGVKRRQERKGEFEGILIVDDFAHHPSAVRETLKALKLRYPGRRCVSIFEPRSASSRRKVFQNAYILAFQEADLIFIAAPYDQSRIALEDQFFSEILVDDLLKIGKKSFLLEKDLHSRVQQVLKESVSGDLLVFFSNGDFDGLVPSILKSLESRQG